MDRELLKKLVILYVEDDDKIRLEMSSLLEGFAGKVFVSADGRDGLETYLKNQDEINLIISDINMPKLNGIEMMEHIRKVDQKIDVIFATAYSDNEYLSDAIKLRVYDYIIKPIDLKHLLSKINQLANDYHKESIITQQNEELEKFKDIIDQNNIVIKTDTDGKITYVNDMFCNLLGYEKDELLLKDLRVLKHNDVSDEIYESMFQDIRFGKSWQGTLKNLKKDGEIIIFDSYIIPILDKVGDIQGTISVNRDITKDVSLKRDLKVTMMKDKGKIFQESKELSAELKAQITAMQNRIVFLEEQTKALIKEKKDMEIDFEKDLSETDRLRSELKLLQKKAESVQDKSTATLKMSKQLADLKHENKTLIENSDQMLESLKKEHNQEIVNLNAQYENSMEELKKYQELEKDFGSIDQFDHQLRHWQKQAQDEAKKVAKLEEELSKYADSGLLKTILGEELNHSLKKGFGKLIKK